jgi:hypothetical protein
VTLGGVLNLDHASLIASPRTRHAETPPSQNRKTNLASDEADVIQVQYATKRHSTPATVWGTIQSQRNPYKDTPPNKNGNTTLTCDNASTYADLTETQYTTQRQSTQAIVQHTIAPARTQQTETLPNKN